MKKIIIWLLLVVLALATVLAISIFRPDRENIEIAIAAPLTNAGKTTVVGGKEMVRGAQLYIKQVNQAGGIAGRKIKLQIYDDRNKEGVATKVARKILNSQALAVIGHYSSNTSLAAGKIYQAKVPAITGSATAMDFYLWFRHQGKDINPEAIEFSNYGTERLDSGEKTSLDQPLVVKNQNGVNNYQLYRVKADFKEKFNFHSSLTRDKLIYAIDYIGMRETTTQAILAKWQQGKVFAEITEWLVNRISFHPDILTN